MLTLVVCATLHDITRHLPVFHIGSMCDAAWHAWHQNSM